jgi:putative oxidoreductase
MMQTGWGKLHNLAKVTEFFTSLGIPLPGLNAPFIVGLEFLGGILIMLGLGSRLVALLLTCDMAVAFATADRGALFSIFSDPDKFYAAAPYTFLVAFLIVLIFGPGRVSLDALLDLVGRTSRSVRMGLRPTNSDENQIGGRAILPAAGFQPASGRLKGGCGQNWPPSNFQ